MKNNYILNLRKSNLSGYTFIDKYQCIFNETFHKTVENTFNKLNECGYKLLNVDDYPSYAGIPVFNIFRICMLFRDIEFYNAFECKNNDILIRWYKVEKTGHIRMKQVIYNKPEHLNKSLSELVTIASMKNYNITVPLFCYNMVENIIVPYNIKGMLLTTEFDNAVTMYLKNDFDYLSGNLPVYINTRKNIIKQSFHEVTDQNIDEFINIRPKELHCAKVEDTEYIFDAKYIRDNTYFD